MDVDAFYLKALKYLQYRPRSEKEIRDYLKKNIKLNVIASVAKQSQESVIPAEAGIQKKTWIPGQARDDNNSGLIDLIIHKLKQQKFLNDEEFARMWVRSRTEFKPKGRRLIQLELQQKGITKEIIEKAFLAFDSTQAENKEEKRNEVGLAKDILERKRKKFEPMEKQERFNKAGSLLARRGFDLDTIKRALEEIDW